MVWTGSLVAVSELLEVWLSSGLLKHLRVAQLDLALLLTGWSNCTFPYLSGKRHMCKPCLYDIVFENKNYQNMFR